jgi:DNA polymerase IV
VRSSPTILHADLDAFYASVEQLLDPALRNRPVAVGGSSHGGVVLAASYEARAFGVHGAMPCWRAKRLCPDLIFVGGHFSEYMRLSAEVMSAFADVTPLVEQVSIDEAFLDVGGAERLFGPPDRIAAELRRRVRADIGLPLSIGVATTKHLAKIASQVAKPDGMVVVSAGSEEQFLDPLPIGLVWGIGPATEARLHGRGIRTIGQLGSAEPGHLQAVLGRANGRTLHQRANNHDERGVSTPGGARSVGAQSALGRQQVTKDLVRVVVGHLADRVARRMRDAGLAGRTVAVRVRFVGMRSITRSSTVTAALSATLTIAEVGEELVGAALADHPDEHEITLIAIAVTNLVRQPTLQLEIEIDDDGGGDARRPGSRVGADRWAIDHAMDRVRSRFGASSVGYMSVALSDYSRVPDEFRELAERQLSSHVATAVDDDADHRQGEADDP